MILFRLWVAFMVWCPTSRAPPRLASLRQVQTMRAATDPNNKPGQLAARRTWRHRFYPSTPYGCTGGTHRRTTVRRRRVMRGDPHTRTPSGDLHTVRRRRVPVHRVGYRPAPWNWTPWEYAGTDGRFHCRWDDP